MTFNPLQVSFGSNKSYQEENSLFFSSSSISKEEDEIDSSLSPQGELSLIQPKASWNSCFINLTSTIIGAGILGVPYGMSLTGYILGTFLIIICALLSLFGLHLMSEVAKNVKYPSSYYKVCEKVLPNYSAIIDFFIMIKGFGIGTSYLIVISDSLPKAFEYFGGNDLLTDRIICLLLSYFIILPLSYLPSLDSLKFSSIISGIMILFLVLLVIVYSFKLEDEQFNPCPSHNELIDDTVTSCSNTSQELFIFNSKTMKAFPIFLFGFSCQQNTFGVVNELKEPSYSRVNTIFIASIGVALFLYLITAYCGYLTYGDNVESDILKTYPENFLTSICRIFVSFIVACHYPLQLHPSRRSALTLWQQFKEEDEVRSFDYKKRFIFFSVIFNGLTLLLAILLEDLGTVLSILGATMSSLVILLLPSIFYFLMYKDSDDKTHKLKSKISLGVFCFGWLFLVISLYFIISDL